MTNYNSTIQISTTFQMHCLPLWSPHNVRRGMDIYCGWLSPHEGKTFLFLLPRYFPFSIHSKTTRYATNLKYNAVIVIIELVYNAPYNRCDNNKNTTHYSLYWQRAIGLLWPWTSPPVYTWQTKHNVQNAAAQQRRKLRIFSQAGVWWDTVNVLVVIL